MPNNETPGEAGLRKRNVELLSDQMNTFYKSGNLIDLMFLAEVMFLHVSTRDTELLSDRILRHLGIEAEADKSTPLESEAPEEPDTAASHNLGNREDRLQDMRSGLYEFAEHLETAMILWRRYPELVESEEFPEPFLSAMRRNREPAPFEVDIEDSELVAAGILPKPRRIRFNRVALERVIRKELGTDFDETAAVWAGDAGAMDLTAMHALLNSNRKPLDVLQDLLICDPEREEDQEPAKLAERTGPRSGEASSAAGA